MKPWKCDLYGAQKGPQVQKNNSRFHAYNTISTPGHKMILHLQKEDPVNAFQFAVVNQTHITPSFTYFAPSFM